MIANYRNLFLYKLFYLSNVDIIHNFYFKLLFKRIFKYLKRERKQSKKVDIFKEKNQPNNRCVY